MDHPPSAQSIRPTLTVTQPACPDDARLERIDNPHPDRTYAVRLIAPEFTSICPKTGQPDFAHMVIDYVPRAFLVESKSFKLFVASFRDHGAYHEDCTLIVARRLQEMLDPIWLRIAGYWNPRGGIPIDVFHTVGAQPQGLWIPDPGIGPYRPR